MQAGIHPGEPNSNKAEKGVYWRVCVLLHGWEGVCDFSSLRPSNGVTFYPKLLLLIDFGRVIHFNARIGRERRSAIPPPPPPSLRFHPQTREVYRA